MVLIGIVDEHGSSLRREQFAVLDRLHHSVEQSIEN